METVFGIIAGCVAILVGLAVILNRKAVSKFTADAQRSTFGKAGEKVADQANPGWTAAVGTVFVLIGATLVVFMITGVEI